MGEFTHAEMDDALCQAFARVAEARPEGYTDGEADAVVEYSDAVRELLGVSSPVDRVLGRQREKLPNGWGDRIRGLRQVMTLICWIRGCHQWRIVSMRYPANRPAGSGALAQERCAWCSAERGVVRP